MMEAEARRRIFAGIGRLGELLQDAARAGDEAAEAGRVAAASASRMVAAAHAMTRRRIS